MTEKELIKQAIEKEASDPCKLTAMETVAAATRRARVRSGHNGLIAAAVMAVFAAAAVGVFAAVSANRNKPDTSSAAGSEASQVQKSPEQEKDNIKSVTQAFEAVLDLELRDGKTVSLEIPGTDLTMFIKEKSITVASKLGETYTTREVLYGNGVLDSASLESVYLTDFDQDGVTDLALQTNDPLYNGSSRVLLLRLTKDMTVSHRAEFCGVSSASFTLDPRYTSGKLGIIIEKKGFNKFIGVPVLWSDADGFGATYSLSEVTEIFAGEYADAAKKDMRSEFASFSYDRSESFNGGDSFDPNGDGAELNPIREQLNSGGTVTKQNYIKEFRGDSSQGIMLATVLTMEEFTSGLELCGCEVHGHIRLGYDTLSGEILSVKNNGDTVLLYEYRSAETRLGDLFLTYRRFIPQRNCYIVYYFRMKDPTEEQILRYCPSQLLRSAGVGENCVLINAYRPSDLADLPKGALSAQYEKDREYINYHFEKSSEGFFLVPDDAVFPSGDGELTIDISVEIGINKSEKTAKKPIGARIKLAELDDLANLKSFSLKFNFPDGADVTHSFAF